MKTFQFVLFAAVCVIFVHADQPALEYEAYVRKVTPELPSPWQLQARPGPQPCDTCSSPWISPPYAPNPAQWYANQGHPQPVSNPYAPGYQTYPGLGTYKVHRYGRTWQNALAICASEGSLLAVIDDYSEAQAIKDLIIGTTSWYGASQLTLSGMHHYWIGAKEYGNNNQFLTLKGERLGSNGYLAWCPSSNQPLNYGNYDCVGFMQDQHNFAAPCSWLHGFVCEKVMSQRQPIY